MWNGPVETKELKGYFDRHPILFEFPGNQKAWLLRGALRIHKYTSIKLLLKDELSLKLRIYESPFTTDNSWNYPSYLKFKNSDTTIKLSANKLTFLQTHVFKKNNKIFLQLVPMDISNKKDKKLIAEILKKEPVAEFNGFTNQLNVNYNWFR